MFLQEDISGFSDDDGLSASLKLHDMIICINGKSVGSMTMPELIIELDVCGPEMMLVVSRFDIAESIAGRDKESMTLEDLAMDWNDIGDGSSSLKRKRVSFENSKSNSRRDELDLQPSLHQLHLNDEAESEGNVSRLEGGHNVSKDKWLTSTFEKAKKSVAPAKQPSKPEPAAKIPSKKTANRPISSSNHHSTAFRGKAQWSVNSDDDDDDDSDDEKNDDLRSKSDSTSKGNVITKSNKWQPPARAKESSPKPSRQPAPPISSSIQHSTKSKGKGRGHGHENDDVSDDNVMDSVPKKWPLRGISRPGNNDRTLGKAHRTYSLHPGNVKYQQLVDDNKDTYAGLPNGQGEKVALSMKLVQDWRSLDPPGRFLKLNKKTDLWDDVGDDEAKMKINQSLADANRKKKRKGSPEPTSQAQKQLDDEQSDDEDEVTPRRATRKASTKPSWRNGSHKSDGESSGSEEENQYNGGYGDENPWLGCVCGRTHPLPIKVFWIQCEECDAWYNVAEDCIGFDEKAAEGIDEWRCWSCDPPVAGLEFGH